MHAANSSGNMQIASAASHGEGAATVPRRSV